MMEVLLAALDDDPAARPTAALFFSQLAKVPLRTQKRESSAVTPATQRAPAQAATADSPRWIDKRRLGVLALVAVLVIALASATAWLISEPTSSSSSSMRSIDRRSPTPTNRPESICRNGSTTP